MDLDVPAMAAKLRKRNQVVVEDDGWSDWCSGDSTEYVAEEVPCDFETSLDEENIVSSECDDDVGAVDPNDKIHQGQLWMPRCDGKIKIRRWDMFTNKSHCMKVVKTYTKKHVDYYPRLVNNPMANSTWVAHKLIDEFRVRGDMDAKDIVDADNEEALHQLQEASPATYAWLMKEPKEHWARYLFDKSSAPADHSSNLLRASISPYYSLELYRATYSGVIYPTEDQRFWPTFKWPLLDPPFVIKKRGPIAKDRVRGPEEGRKRPTRSRTVRCSKCNGLHHNSLTCKGQGNKPSIRIRKRPAPLDGTGQKRRGRPRKQAPVSTVCQPSSTEPPSS
ncbi:hypothetical protein Cgig2_031831 [Carnegiea gigantea]|uniref:Uncharacterized protein n=1 Tax=Carnegiea gigantea TaxID=171969 RepID=A0A9Q1QMW4_9CARY|nr:hypothetical protein Cgig2_031831 [Carnegiea gigantea]